MSILVSLRGPSQLRLIASVGGGCLFLLGCGASEPPPLGTLDPSSTTHPGVTATGGAVEGCLPEVPPGAYITDFSDWSGDVFGREGALSGEAFTYVGDTTMVFDYQIDTGAGNMHVTGQVLDYAGFGLSFGPCTDATAFSGVQFDLWGTAGSALFQIQTSEDQNEEYGDPRAVCSNAEVGECKIPQVRLDDLSATPTTLQFAWADLTGGVPVDSVSPNQILGLQWQFECGGGEGCPVDVRLDNVMFY